MGVQIGDIVEKESILIESLEGRKFAIDAYNTLYQFLSIIRQPDGTPLMNHEGKITSHFSGLFYRTVKLITKGIKPIYVFDGVPPVLKKETIKERQEIREKARKEWKDALKEEDIERAYTKATQSSKLTKEMVEESKILLERMGVPYVQAPSEGEAQAAHMCSKGDVWAACSQDFDSILFGSPILVRNITITGKRKIPRRNIYVDVSPEVIKLKETLGALEISKDQLIEIGLMVGTDFNSGIKGIGPKKALLLVKKGKTAEQVYREQGIDCEIDLDKARDLFKNPDVTGDYSFSWKPPKREEVISFLCDKYDFSLERINIAKMTSAVLKMKRG